MANPPPPRMPLPPKPPLAPWRVKLARAAPWVLLVFAAGGLIQVFLAGYGVTELGAEGMDLHIGFAHLIEMLPLLVLLFGFIGGDWRMGVVGAVLLVLFLGQYLLLGQASAAVRAIHAANGVLLIAIALSVFVHRRPWADATRADA